jgi:8-oxo-dGTP diphosphatase
MNDIIITTMCYIQHNNQTLLLHRIKKENDINEGKWIGVGGKVEKGEDPFECIEREIKEETGIEIKDLKLHGYVTFPSLYHGRDEGMFVYSCQYFQGNIKECDEGVLQWIDNDKIKDLNIWEADYHFFDWLKDNKFHTAKITYKNDQLIEYKEY